MFGLILFTEEAKEFNEEADAFYPGTRACISNWPACVLMQVSRNAGFMLEQLYNIKNHSHSCVRQNYSHVHIRGNMSPAHTDSLTHVHSPLKLSYNFTHYLYNTFSLLYSHTQLVDFTNSCSYGVTNLVAFYSINVSLINICH